MILSYLCNEFAAALRLSAGGSMLQRTGSHGSGEGRSVPDMSRMLLFMNEHE